MSFILLYCLFALATAICAVYELLHPVVQRRAEEKLEVNNKCITYIVFFLMTIITAPLVFFSCIIPSMGETFRKFLYIGLFEKE